MLCCFCPALTKLALDLHVNFCLFVCVFVCLSGLFFKASNWLSSATLKNFISGVSSRILMR